MSERHSSEAPRPASSPSARRPPLDGLLVLDLSRVLAGPLATMLLPTSAHG
jgi:crotonobetainyl-CoA:carnitine CoA-transferase CaiB-like acyl-CoA transferase